MSDYVGEEIPRSCFVVIAIIGMICMIAFVIFIGWAQPPL